MTTGEMRYSPSFRTSTTKIWTGEKSMCGTMVDSLKVTLTIKPTERLRVFGTEGTVEVIAFDVSSEELVKFFRDMEDSLLRACASDGTNTYGFDWDEVETVTIERGEVTEVGLQKDGTFYAQEVC